VTFSSYAARSGNPTEMRRSAPVRMKPPMNFNCHLSNPITDDVEMNETFMPPFLQLTLAFPCQYQRFEQLRPISCYAQLLRFKQLTFGRRFVPPYAPSTRVQTYYETHCENNEQGTKERHFATRRTGGITEQPKGDRDRAEWRRFTTATGIKISEIFPLVLTSSRPRLWVGVSRGATSVVTR